MGKPPRQAATYDDVLRAPEHCIAQIVGGELFVHPRPAGPHLVATTGLGFDIGGAFQRGRGGPGGWVILYAPELHFGADIVVPDQVGWRAERAPDFRAKFFTTPPDWVCEVLSPHSVTIDRGRKADVYSREGVGFMWLVDPEAMLIEAFQRLETRWLRLGVWSGDAEARTPPFDAVAIELGPLWVKPAEGDKEG